MPRRRPRFRIIELSEEADIDAVEEATGVEFYSALEGAEHIFWQCEIRISRAEDMAFAALDEQGSIVGAATYGNSQGEEGLQHTFSVAVLPQYRRQGIARALVQAVMSKASEISADHGVQPHYRVWAVNPHMAHLLESMDFDTAGPEWSPATPHMTRAYNNPKPKRKKNKTLKARRRGVSSFIDKSRLVADQGLEEDRTKKASSGWAGATHLEYRLHERLGIAPQKTKAVVQQLIRSLNQYKPAQFHLKKKHGHLHGLIGVPGYGAAYLWGYKGRVVLRSWWPPGAEKKNELLAWPKAGVDDLRRILEAAQ